MPDDLSIGKGEAHFIRVAEFRYPHDHSADFGVAVGIRTCGAQQTGLCG